jgi:hypothetical protein
VAVPQHSHGDPPAAAAPVNLSAFVARVLDQLSLSAWLPGAFLIFSAASVIWFRANGAVSFGGIGPFVKQNWVPVLVLALPALIITTLLTQAFSFDVIRSLEGYWRRRGPVSWLRTVCIKHQLHRKRSLQKRRTSALKAAFSEARPLLSADGIDWLVLLAIEMDLANAEQPAGMSPEQEKEAENLDWVSYCEPWVTARLVRLRQDLREFPKDSRIMPTLLGNILRVAEDDLRNKNGDVEGFVMRNREIVPSRVLEHHDQFRTRLDMYCTLVFVAIAVAVASVPALWQTALLGRVAVPLALFLIALASYGAALSSARGYATVLRQIDLLVPSAVAKKP